MKAEDVVPVEKLYRRRLNLYRRNRPFNLSFGRSEVRGSRGARSEQVWSVVDLETGEELGTYRVERTDDEVLGRTLEIRKWNGKVESGSTEVTDAWEAADKVWRGAHPWWRTRLWTVMHWFVVAADIVLVGVMVALVGAVLISLPDLFLLREIVFDSLSEWLKSR